jgi:hypothetical protein
MVHWPICTWSVWRHPCSVSCRVGSFCGWDKATFPPSHAHNDKYGIYSVSLFTSIQPSCIAWSICIEHSPLSPLISIYRVCIYLDKTAIPTAIWRYHITTFAYSALLPAYNILDYYPTICCKHHASCKVRCLAELRWHCSKVPKKKVLLRSRYRPPKTYYTAWDCPTKFVISIAQEAEVVHNLWT